MPAGRAAKMFSSGHKEKVRRRSRHHARPRLGKRSLAARSERSERPVAGTDERRKLTKPGRGQAQSERHHRSSPGFRSAVGNVRPCRAVDGRSYPANPTAVAPEIATSHGARCCRWRTGWRLPWSRPPLPA
jgi:hypothetical protein